MNRRQADRIVGALLGLVLLIGLFSTGQLLVSDDPMMGHAGSVPAIHVLGPVLLSLLVVAVVAGVYVVLRSEWIDAEGHKTRVDTGSPNVGPGAADSLETTTAASEATDTASDDSSTQPEAASSPEASATISRAERRVLDLLPADERRILEPVIESPGITQTAVADRADYSRSKVSQTVTDLEERGLLYRKRQGRTYRVYPADDFQERR